MRIKQADAKSEQKPEDAPAETPTLLDTGELIEAELDEDVIGPDGIIEFKRGDTVLVRGLVVGVHGEGREPAYQSFMVQLSDGQGIHTNVYNLSPLPEEGESVGTKAQRPGRDKSRKPDFTKETVLIGGVPVLREAFEFLAKDWLESQTETETE